MQNALGKTLGLDTIEISPGGQLGSGSFKVGRYVTQDLFLSLGREAGQDSGTSGGTSVGLEYSLNRRMKVRGSSSDRGETAADAGGAFGADLVGGLLGGRPLRGDGGAGQHRAAVGK